MENDAGEGRAALRVLPADFDLILGKDEGCETFMQTQNPARQTPHGVMELLTGFEPVTSSLPRMRATDCAIAACRFMQL